MSLPACRIIFEAGEHADGEQRYLPILEDKEWLTQTQPFVVSHEGDTVIRLGGLFQGNHPEADDSPSDGGIYGQSLVVCRAGPAFRVGATDG